MTFEEVGDLDLMIDDEILIIFSDKTKTSKKTTFYGGPCRGYTKPKKKIDDYINIIDNPSSIKQIEVVLIESIEKL